MRRMVVNVATGAHYVRGQERLTEALASLGEDYLIFRDVMPPGSPSHQETPYGFKAWALEAAREKGGTMLLWADASIVPIRAIDPIWEYAAEHGVWLADNGWNNSQWTCDAAYPDLFPDSILQAIKTEEAYAAVRSQNRKIQHVVATAFALDLNHRNGALFFYEYLRLAQTSAFKGPWWNSNGERPDYASKVGARPCGPPECLGHRHDQSCASVIAWRLGIPLTQSPTFFTYDGQQTEETILIAKGI